MKKHKFIGGGCTRFQGWEKNLGDPAAMHGFCSHTACLCFKPLIQNWLASRKLKLNGAQTDSASRSCWMGIKKKCIGHKSKYGCNSFKSQRVCGGGFTVNVRIFPFFVPNYYSDFLMSWESSGLAATGSWVPAPRQVCKFYYRLHSNVITLLPLSHEWNRSFSFFLFFKFSGTQLICHIRSICYLCDPPSRKDGDRPCLDVKAALKF